MVKRIVERYTGEAIKQALRYVGSNSYVLPIVVRSGRMDIFMLLYPFVTRCHIGLLGALYSAISRSDRAVITLLIPHVNEDHYPDTLYFAYLWSSSELVRWFLSQLSALWRADASQVSMVLAVKTGEVELLEVLIAGGGDQNTLLNPNKIHEDIQSGTILHYLAYWGLTNINESHRPLKRMIHMLCETGADVNAVDNHGRTALHILARIGSFSVEQHLWSLNIIPTIRIDLIYGSIIQTLIEFGARLDMKDADAMTPRDYADNYDEQTMINILGEHRYWVPKNGTAIETAERAMADLTIA